MTPFVPAGGRCLPAGSVEKRLVDALLSGQRDPVRRVCQADMRQCPVSPAGMLSGTGHTSGRRARGQRTWFAGPSDPPVWWRPNVAYARTHDLHDPRVAGEADIGAIVMETPSAIGSILLDIVYDITSHAGRHADVSTRDNGVTRQWMVVSRGRLF